MAVVAIPKEKVTVEITLVYKGPFWYTTNRNGNISSAAPLNISEDYSSAV